MVFSLKKRVWVFRNRFMLVQTSSLWWWRTRAEGLPVLKRPQV